MIFNYNCKETDETRTAKHLKEDINFKVNSVFSYKRA